MLKRLAQAHTPWCSFQALTRCQMPWRRSRVGGAAEAVHAAADEVAEGVAAEDVEADQDGIGGDEEDAQAQAEAAVVDHRHDQVPPQHDQRDEGQVEREAVRVHEDEREACSPSRSARWMLGSPTAQAGGSRKKAL